MSALLQRFLTGLRNESRKRKVRYGKMRGRIALSVGLACFLTIASGQTAPEEPQYLNNFYGVGADGRLIELERVAVTFHAKTRALPGYATVKMTTQFKPGVSSVRLPSAVQFVVRGRAGGINPVSRFELRLLQHSKAHREFVMMRGHGSIIGGAATSNLDEGAVPLRFEEHGAASYRITPTKALSPGEYALAVRGMASELYCFGVD